MWNDQQIKQHTAVAKTLTEIVDQTFEYIRQNKNISEWEIQQYIFKKFEQYNLSTDKDPPIVGFDENAAYPHYYPTKNSKRLKPNSLILIDIWARLKNKRAPFADITWMAYYGNIVPKQIQEAFDIVIKARDNCLQLIESQLKIGKIPTGKQVDDIAQDYIAEAGFGDKFIHNTGHCIGMYSPHGNRLNIDEIGFKPLLTNYGYTIEPGIYIENQFGIRSEIDFYITNNKKLMITTRKQDKIVKI